jgi:hypothetical protein
MEWGMKSNWLEADRDGFRKALQSAVVVSISATRLGDPAPKETFEENKP